MVSKLLYFFFVLLWVVRLAFVVCIDVFSVLLCDLITSSLFFRLPSPPLDFFGAGLSVAGLLSCCVVVRFGCCHGFWLMVSFSVIVLCFVVCFGVFGFFLGGGLFLLFCCVSWCSFSFSVGCLFFLGVSGEVCSVLWWLVFWLASGAWLVVSFFSLMLLVLLLGGWLCWSFLCFCMCF